MSSKTSYIFPLLFPGFHSLPQMQEARNINSWPDFAISFPKEKKKIYICVMYIYLVCNCNMQQQIDFHARFLPLKVF